MHILTPPHRYNHGLDEVTVTIRCGLAHLAATGFAMPDRPIVVGAHLLATDIPAAVLYNFEQHGSPQLNETTLDRFRRHEVWDYSPSNIAWLAELGVKAKYVPIGYVPELKRIEPAATQDIDVLFYGLVNNRRRKILDGLRGAGLNVCDAYALHNGPVYGSLRDALIARSKIVLNVHYYETGIFEIVRCSYLFANVICVVSENSIDVPGLLTDVRSAAFPLRPYDEIVDCCVTLCRMPALRFDIAVRTHDAFRNYSEPEILQEALNLAP